MKQRKWQVSTNRDGKRGVYEFFADSKELAHAHAVQLRDDPGFKHDVLVSDNPFEQVYGIAVRFVCWE